MSIRCQFQMKLIYQFQIPVENQCANRYLFILLKACRISFYQDEWLHHTFEDDMESNKQTKDLTLQELQRQVDAWINRVGVRYFNELTNMAMLTEEVGEVARIIARRYGEQSEKPADAEKVLADELADVLFVLVCLANQTGVDLNEAFLKNLEKKTQRDGERHTSNPKLNGQ